MVATNSTPLTVQEAFEVLHPVLKSIVSKGSQSYQEATTAAGNLVAVCRTVRNSLYQTESLESQTLNLKSLKERIIPLAQVDILIGVLAHERIQTVHPLKKLLSLSVRFLIELAAFQCLLQDQTIQEDSANSIITNIKKALKTLPKKEVVNRFELKCCLAAAKIFDIDEETKKKLRHKHTQAIGLAILQTILSARPVPPYVSLNALIPDVVNLTADLYNLLEEPWYKTVWLLRWHSAEERVNTLEDFEAIKKLLKQYKSEHMLAIYTSQLFMQIVTKAGVDEGLKRELIAGDGELSLVALAKYSPRVYLEATKLRIPLPRYKDAFWEARLQSLNNLRSLVRAHGTNLTGLQQIAEVAVERVFNDKKGLVVESATSLMLEIGKINPALVEGHYRKFMSVDSIVQNIQDDAEAIFKNENPDVAEAIEQGQSVLRGEFPENCSTASSSGDTGLERIREAVDVFSNYKKNYLEEFYSVSETRARLVSLMDRTMKTQDWNQALQEVIGVQIDQKNKFLDNSNLPETPLILSSVSFGIPSKNIPYQSFRGEDSSERLYNICRKVYTETLNEETLRNLFVDVLQKELSYDNTPKGVLEQYLIAECLDQVCNEDNSSGRTDSSSNKFLESMARNYAIQYSSWIEKSLEKIRDIIPPQPERPVNNETSCIIL